MDSKTKLYSLTLNEDEIDSLCTDLLLCSEEPSVVGCEILKLNGQVWKPENRVVLEEDLGEVVEAREEVDYSTQNL